jgi:hypothetical protein
LNLENDEKVEDSLQAIQLGSRIKWSVAKKLFRQFSNLMILFKGALSFGMVFDLR